MEFKGTKRAKWKCNHNASGLFGIMPITEVFIESTDTELGEWIAQIRGNSEEERKANAQLIATAPEMLEMLQLTLIELESGAKGHWEITGMIKQLIEKANKID